jgi:hypothetical protein
VKTKTQEIDGYRFILKQIPAIPATKLAAKIGRVLSPALTALGSGERLTDLSLEQMAKALSSLFTTLDDRTIDELVPPLLAQALVDCMSLPPPFGPKNLQMNVSDEDMRAFLFDGRLMLMLKVIAAVVRYNFDDFFTTLGAARAAQPQAVPGT